MQERITVNTEIYLNTSKYSDKFKFKIKINCIKQSYVNIKSQINAVVLAFLVVIYKLY